MNVALYFRNECKSLLRGCLKRPPQRHALAEAVIDKCVDCENTKRYVKSSVEIFHHFSNPSLNRRWICDNCESDNNSVTWHCLVCDTVSYLAPIYKETLHHPKHLLDTNASQVNGAINSKSITTTCSNRNNNNHSVNNGDEQLKSELLPFEPLGTRRSVDNSCSSRSTKRDQFQQQQNDKGLKSFHLRRTQSLTTDKSSYSCRSCYNCFVNNRKDILKLSESPFVDGALVGVFGSDSNTDRLFGKWTEFV